MKFALYLNTKPLVYDAFLRDMISISNFGFILKSLLLTKLFIFQQPRLTLCSQIYYYVIFPQKYSIPHQIQYEVGAICERRRKRRSTQTSYCYYYYYYYCKLIYREVLGLPLLLLLLLLFAESMYSSWTVLGWAGRFSSLT